MRTLSLLASSLLLTGMLCAQTPGVSGVNDYYIVPGGASGGASCKPLTIFTPATMVLTLVGAPSTAYVIVWSTCPCVACSPLVPMGTSSCLPAPSAACPTSNQFLEVGLFGSCSTLAFNGTTTASGAVRIVVPLSAVSIPITLSTQAAFVGAPGCVVPPLGLLFSQAWSVTFV